MIMKVSSLVGILLLTNCISSSTNISLDRHSRNGVVNYITDSLMNRGFPTATGGASQVVSLNLTNLVVLILLKALIFAAGSLGAGYWKGGYARSNDEDKFITDEELLLFLSFLTGTNTNNQCLQSVACQQPQYAKKYVEAGDVLLQTARSMSINADNNYDTLLEQMREATNWGLSGGDCNKYICRS